MQRSLLSAALVGLSLLAASCTIRNGELDATSWVEDRITDKQDDRVILEAGRGTAPASNLPDFAHTGGAASAAAPAAGGALYTVRSGDTLSGIAARHHSSVAAIRRANGLTSDNIAIGKKLTIPRVSGSAPATAHKAPAAGAGRCVVKKGDTVSAIARRYHLSTAALLKANNLTPATASTIKPGTVLRIPAHR